MTRREKAIKRRRKFIATVAICFVAVLGIIVAIVCVISKDTDNGKENEVSKPIVSSTVSSAVSKSETPETSAPKNKIDSKTGLDTTYSNLMLVNGSHPLPDNYDSEVRKDLVEIDKKLRNNDYVTKIHKTVYPYIKAMVEAAQNDGVELKIWSPFRSFADQNVLFENQVKRVGGDEEKAATVVARAGTSEHNTGICADFNMADDAFENTPMYEWMCKNAENYGFILRYPKSKQDKTGVIYESWHWRFVGIEMAKKINESGLCLEEYIEQNNLFKESSADNF
ncbi:MAG: M15 family metallopeptidase [Clostridia bacterium]|nr:M15 family metallopeptidase [Clostridia bacterium]